MSTRVTSRNSDICVHLRTSAVNSSVTVHGINYLTGRLLLKEGSMGGSSIVDATGVSQPGGPRCVVAADEKEATKRVSPGMFHPVSSRNGHAQYLAQINDTDKIYPGTNLRLRYELVSDLIREARKSGPNVYTAILIMAGSAGSSLRR